jgi:hypothetical protein
LCILFQVNNPQEILSPAIMSQSGLTSPDPEPTVWDPWTIIYHFQTLGPLRVPAHKLGIHSSARKHTFQDIEELTDAIIDDDQRALHPVLAELTSGIITKDQFYKFLHTIKSSTDFPTHILNAHSIIGHVIHGAKRLRAVQRLLDSHVYVKFIYPGIIFLIIYNNIYIKLTIISGTYDRHKNLIDAFVLQLNSNPLQTIPTAIDTLLVAGRLISRLVASAKLTKEDFKSNFQELTVTLASVIKYGGPLGGQSELRRARDFAKRPILIHWLHILSKSPLFREAMTPNMFRTMSNWDMTVRCHLSCIHSNL